MEEKLTIQQAIFKVSELQENLNESRRRLYNEFFGPTKINGKSVIDKNKVEEEVKLLDEIEDKNSEIAELKEKIAKANIENKINGKSVAYTLEILRQKRALVASIGEVLNNSRTTVESGVGAVVYGAYDSEKLREIYDNLKKETYELSSKVDKINAETLI